MKKPGNEPHYYEPYDYDSDRGFSPLGAEVLTGEQSALQSAEKLPEKIGAFTKAYVEHDPSRTEQELAAQFKNQMQKMSPDDEAVLFSLEMDARTEQVGIRLAEKKTKEQIAKVREQLSELDDYDRIVVEGNFMDALIEDWETSAIPLFMRWNAEREGARMPWVEWLSKPLEEGGATDEQLKNVLQWNEYQFQKLNNDPDTKNHLRLLELCFEQGLGKAVAAGELSPVLLENYDKQPQPTITIADPLSVEILGSHGYIHTDKYAGDVHGRSIVLNKNWKSRTFLHERTHLLGRYYQDHDANEAMTDIIGKKIYEHSPVATVDAYDAAYIDGVEILDGFMALADMDTKEASELYAKRDGEQFITRLGEGTRSGDFLKERQGLFDRIEDRAKKENMPTSLQFISSAAADYMQQVKRSHQAQRTHGVQ